MHIRATSSSPFVATFLRNIYLLSPNPLRTSSRSLLSRPPHNLLSRLHMEHPPATPLTTFIWTSLQGRRSRPPPTTSSRRLSKDLFSRLRLEAPLTASRHLSRHLFRPPLTLLSRRPLRSYSRDMLSRTHPLLKDLLSPPLWDLSRG